MTPTPPILQDQGQEIKTVESNIFTATPPLLRPFPKKLSAQRRAKQLRPVRGGADQLSAPRPLLKMIYGSRSDQGIRDKSEQKIPIAGRRARLRVGENTSVVPQRRAESVWDSPERRTLKQQQKTSFQKQRGHDRDAGKHPNAGRVTAQWRSPEHLNRQPEAGRSDQEQATHPEQKNTPSPHIESCR